MRSSLSVRSAFVSALCACGKASEAAAALQELLDLYATAYSSKGTPSGNKQPGEEASSRVQDAQQMIPVDPEKRRPGATEGSLQQTSPGVGGGGLDHWKDADRAAAQACHQVIHAAERARDAALAHKTLLAMHKVNHPACDCLGIFFGRPGSPFQACFWHLEYLVPMLVPMLPELIQASGMS